MNVTKVLMLILMAFLCAVLFVGCSFYEGYNRAVASADALDRASDPRCSYRRKAQALRRAQRAEPVVAAMQAMLRRLTGS